jgi:selenocysteine lyase/cysteine desulfurase
MAKIMHKHGGYCFVDFAASAPYVKMDMHPANPAERLDAIFFSPHKFLGGPGSSGVLIFDAKLYRNRVPDQPGGGTVAWTDPWGHHRFFQDIEVREDGGTPGFLQSIRAALVIKLKEQMTTEKILAREEELLGIAFPELRKIPGIHLLADHIEHRLGVISFYFNHIHYNFIVKSLNDRYGIQVRGGCSCAGTYGHYLLHVSQELSRRITSKIDHGDLSEKPGWVRLSLHPTMTNEELHYIIEAIREIALNAETWIKDYIYSSSTNEFHHVRQADERAGIYQWFEY